MKKAKDFDRIKKCINYIRLKALDYGLAESDIPSEFFTKLADRISIYGNHLGKLETYYRDTMNKALQANNCSIKDETALVALGIIKKTMNEYMELTDTYPKQILKMSAEEMFNIIKEFNEEPREVRIAAYVLGQYKITATSNSPVEEPIDEDEDDEDEDWFDLEEEEDDENEFIK